MNNIPEDFADDDEQMIANARQKAAEQPEEQPQVAPPERMISKPEVAQKEEDTEIGADEMDRESILKEEEPVDPDDKVPDLSNMFILIPAVPEALEVIFKNADMSPNNLLKEESVNGKLFRLAKGYAGMTQAQRLAQSMLEDKNLEYLKDRAPIQHSSGNKFEHHTAIDDPQEAILQLSARLSQIKRMRLVNSGYYIAFKKLKVSEIKIILDQIDDAGKQLARVLGGHFYAMSDYFYVQQIGLLLKHVVGGSNLNKWNHGNNLIKHMSIHDFNDVLCVLGSHLFTDGVKYVIECPQENCSYSEKLKLDIEETRLVEWSRLPEKAIKRLFSDDTFTTKDYLQYQEAIGAYDTVNVTSDITMHIKVPTIFTFLKHGEDLVGRMIKALYADERVPTDDEILEWRVLNYHKNFLGWIEKVVCHPISEDDKGCTIVRKEAIEDLLEPNIWEQHEERTKFLDFFKKSQLVHHGVLGKQCPLCKAVPDPKLNGFMALDMHSFFYNLSAFHMLRSLSS